MAVIDFILILFIGLSFLFYGLSCLSSKYMIAEFKRYGLTSSQRKLTGLLQIIGALGLLCSFIDTAIGTISAIGLALLMLSGFVVRIKIKDSFLQSAPSFIFMLLNTYLAFRFLEILPY